MKAATILLMGAGLLSAQQLSLRFTPEPMAVTQSILPQMRSMGRWQVMACNDGSQTVSVTKEKLVMAASDIAFVDSTDANIVLMSEQGKSTGARLVKIGSVLSGLTAIALTAISKSNLSWAAGLSLGAATAPTAFQIIQNQIPVPSIAPLQTTIKYPYILAPGGCLTDEWYAGKMKNPQPRNAAITITVPPPSNGLESLPMMLTPSTPTPRLYIIPDSLPPVVRSSRFSEPQELDCDWDDASSTMTCAPQKKFRISLSATDMWRQ